MIIPIQALSNLKPPPILTAAQVTERLSPVPGFILVNAMGQPLTAKPAESKGPATIGVFLRAAAAEAFLTEVRKSNPALGDTLKLKVVRLGELYALVQKPEAQLSLTFVPDKVEVEQAQGILKQRAELNKVDKVDRIVGVPLFVAELPGKGLLNITQNGKSIVPVFFSLSDLTPMLERYNKLRPEGAPEPRIVLTSLEFLLENWRKTVDPALAQMQLMVNKIVLEDVKTVNGGK